MIKTKKKILGYEKLLPNMKNKSYNVSTLIEEWMNYTISNLEFLMKLNLFSGRSFHDLNQYPIFPWLIANYSNDTLSEKNLRNLSIPMGMMELDEKGKKRKQSFIDFYENLKLELEENYPEFEYQIYLNKGTEYLTNYKKKMLKNLKKEKNNDIISTDNINIPYNQYPYFYGSHYSNCTYVSHYLSRIFPFSFVSIEIQGNKFDEPDRMFFSLEKTFESVTSFKDDVRELIPEFYFLPEMFKNNNNINLAQDAIDINGNNISINDVIMPSWCNNNPIDFIIKQRQILENNIYINKRISILCN